MKKFLSVLIVFLMIFVFAACDNGTEKGTNDTENKGSSETAENTGDTSEAGDTTTDSGSSEPDYLQFAVTEGDFGDMFRADTNWTGDKTVQDQTMSVKTTSTSEATVDWAGVCAGKSFEYETKLRVNSFGGSYVATRFETETHLLSASVYENKIVLIDDKNAEVSIDFSNDKDWHIYRFSVTDNTAKVWVDGTLLGTVVLPEKASSGLLSFAAKSADGSEVSYDVDYVKVKTTEEGWISPEKRMTEVSEWYYAEEFDGTEIPAGWVQDGGVDGEALVKDGNLILSTSNKGEFIYKYTSEKIKKCNSYVFEIKLKGEFCQTQNSRISILNFMGNNWRIHSQFKENGYNMQNPSDSGTTWTTGSVNGADEEYHTLRCEVKITDETTAECRVFIDGIYSYTCAMNNNNGAACLKVIAASTADGETCTAYVDYIKIAILD